MGCKNSKGEITPVKKSDLAVAGQAASLNKVHPEMKVGQVEQSQEPTVASARGMDGTSAGVKSTSTNISAAELHKPSRYGENNNVEADPFYQPAHEQTKSMLHSATGLNKLQTQNKNQLIEQDTVEDQKQPVILFNFDFQNLKFHYFHIMTHRWDSNNLSESSDDCPKCPLFKYKEPKEIKDAVEFARYMSYIVFSDNVIFIIGGYNSYYSCLEYHIEENKFYCRDPIKVSRNNPSLYRRGKEIFAVSGDLIDAFSPHVAKYHVGRNEWTPLPDLPGPQGFASVTSINEKVDPSLIVLGGLSQKFPRTHVSTLSLFNFREEKWAEIDLSKLIPTRVPKFLNSVVVQTKESEVIILGAENTKSVYKFDLLEGTLVAGGKLPIEENFKEPMRSREALWRDGQVYCLAHSSSKGVYKGDIVSNKWDLI